MQFPEQVSIPVSSDSPILNLLGCYLSGFDGDLPLDEYLDPFELDENKFSLYTQANKYLGEDLYLLSGNTTQNTITISNEIFEGQNLLDVFSTISNDGLVSRPISSTILPTVGTAGQTFLESDIIWQFDNDCVEGAWLKDGSTEVYDRTARFKLDSGQNEFRFPYPSMGLSSTSGWTGKGIDNCNANPYYQNVDGTAVENIYWADRTELSSSTSIPLYETTLIAEGANASTNIFYADQILSKATRESEGEEFAWLYDFTHTELPIKCGTNQLYWPLARYEDSSEQFPFKVNGDQVEDIALSSLWITKTMCGAIAGLRADTSDQIFKTSGECGAPVEGAWLKGCDVSFCSPLIPLSSSDELVCSSFDFYVEDDILKLSGSFLSGSDEPILLDCCEAENLSLSSISSRSTFSNVVGTSTNADWVVTTNKIAWGLPVSRRSFFEYTPKVTPELIFDEFFEIGSVLFRNEINVAMPSTVITNFDWTVSFFGASYTNPVEILSPTSNLADDRDRVVLRNTNAQQKFTLCEQDLVLDIQFGVKDGSDIKLRNEFIAPESDSTELSVFAKVSRFKEELYFFQDLVDYSADGYKPSLTRDENCRFSVSFESQDETLADFEIGYDITSDGLSSLFLTPDDGGGLSSYDISIPIQYFQPKKRELANGSRQTGLHAVFQSGSAGYFFWEFPDKPLDEVIQGYDHDEHCDYLDINKYESIINPDNDGETSQWAQCNCKSQYYSPFGHNLNFEDNFGFADIVFEDDGKEIFSLETWRDSENFNYRESENFAIFRYQGVEPDVGFGVGEWQTYGGQPMVLQKGKSYKYLRSSFGDCDDAKPPCLVVRNCHCLDKCDDRVCNVEWMKLVQKDDGTWEDTGEPSDMVLRAGQFYQYDKQDSISYDIVRDGACITRTTSVPSFTLNVPFENALPYWADSPRIGGLPFGLSATETDKYLCTTQPKPSTMILTDDMYVKYFRNDCSALRWEQPLTFTVNTDNPPTWKKLEFSFVSPPLLQKILGCSTCDIKYDSSGDSCFLMDVNCNSHIAKFTATDEDSDMVLRTTLGCNNDTKIYFEAKSDFTWTEEFFVEEFTESADTQSLVTAVQPWRNLLNENQSIVHFDERSGQTVTGNQIGLFKPKHVGTNKIECFDL